ncbi:phosphatase PAP2 family protein [Phenylobacterium sp.]|uniref:acid phosphatase n=1 Tax=Phenylobacterium sp. TaxID=1871053 RepID=UPI002811E9F0|nr:phosphatase PAP2 family protein [Phenylobacterium sp.]
MFRTLTTACAVATMAACAAAPAADPALSQAPAGHRAPGGQTEGYLTAAALSGKDILPGPPAPGSAYDVADRANYDATRSLEGSPRWKLAQQDNDLWQGGALKRFSCAMGKEISAQKTPVAWKLLHKIELDVRVIGTPAKNHFDRKRPALDNDKPICVPREDWMRTNASYPSGHSMVAWSWALILTEAMPAKADALLKLGQESGDSRVICGVHYPSDVEAGRVLASGMVARLHAEPAFTADLATMKRELAAAPPAEGCGA